jgi:copper transporter 1
MVRHHTRLYTANRGALTPELRNTQIVNTCVVFPGWHIKSNSSFVFSCMVIVGLGIFYEYLREFQKKYDLHLALALNGKGKGKLRISSGRSTPEVLEQEQSALLGKSLWKVAATG